MKGSEMFEMFVVGFITGLFGYLAMVMTEVLAGGSPAHNGPVIFHGQYQ
jgi:hypothetical protein